MLKITINGIIFSIPPEKLKEIPYFASRMSGRWTADSVIDDPNLDVPSLLIYIFHRDINDTLQKQRELVDYLGASPDKIQGLVLPLETLMTYVDKRDFRNLNMLQHYELNLDNPLPKSGLLDKLLDLNFDKKEISDYDLNDSPNYDPKTDLDDADSDDDRKKSDVDDLSDNLNDDLNNNMNNDPKDTLYNNIEIIRPILHEWISVLAQESHRLEICSTPHQDSKFGRIINEDSKFGRIINDPVLLEKIISDFSGKELCPCLKFSFNREFFSFASFDRETGKMGIIDLPFELLHEKIKKVINFIDFPLIISEIWNRNHKHPNIKPFISMFHDYNPTEFSQFMDKWISKHNNLDYVHAYLLEMIFSLKYPLSEVVLNHSLKWIIRSSSSIKFPEQLINQILQRGFSLTSKHTECAIGCGSLMIHFLMSRGAPFEIKFLDDLLLQAKVQMSYGDWEFFDKIYQGVQQFTTLQKKYLEWLNKEIFCPSTGRGLWHPSADNNPIVYFKKWGLSLSQRNDDGSNLIGLMASAVGGIETKYYEINNNGIEIIEQLIKEGVERSNRNKNKRLPLHYLFLSRADVEQMIKICEILFDPRERLDEYNNNPLHIMAKWDKQEIKLINYFKYRFPKLFNETNSEGKTPNQIHLERGYGRKTKYYEIDPSLIERHTVSGKYQIKVIELYSCEELKSELLKRGVPKITIKPLKHKQDLYDHLLKICQQNEKID